MDKNAYDTFKFANVITYSNDSKIFIIYPLNTRYYTDSATVYQN